MLPASSRLAVLKARYAQWDNEAPRAFIEAPIPIGFGLVLSMMFTGMMFFMVDAVGHVGPIVVDALVMKEKIIGFGVIMCAVWSVACLAIFHLSTVAAARRQAHFDAWAHRQGWTVEEWARVALSPELPRGFSRLARCWLNATSPGWLQAPEAEEEPPVPSVFQRPPTWSREAWKNLNPPLRTLFFIPFVVTTVAIILCTPSSPFSSLVSTSMYLVSLALTAVILVAHDRALETARAATLAHHNLPPEEWARIQASNQVASPWLPVIHRHLADNQPGWSLLPSTPLWRQKSGARYHYF